MKKMISYAMCYLMNYKRAESIFSKFRSFRIYCIMGFNYLHAY